MSFTLDNQNLSMKGRDLNMFIRQKYLYSIIPLLFLLMVVTTVSASTLKIDDENRAEEPFEKMVPVEVQQAMTAQEPALEAYLKLSESFEKDEFGIPVYPDGYAGEYINENNQLVLLVVNESSFL